MRSPKRDGGPLQLFPILPTTRSLTGESVIRAAAVATGLILCFSGCSPRPRPVIALDEAFASTRPTLAEELRKTGGAGLVPRGWDSRSILVPIHLGDSPAEALEAAKAEDEHRGPGSAIVASPLVAKAIVEGGAWSGEPPLIVPGWRGGTIPGLWRLGSDPVPAYRAAGAAVGAYIATLAKGGGSPICGVVYAESPTRPRAALAAFAEAYSGSSGGRAPEIRELGVGGDVNAGARETAPAEAPLPPDRRGDRAKAAVADLLGRDLRVLFVAVGPEAEEAIQAGTRPGIAVGADFPYPEVPSSLAFRIVPDSSGIAMAIGARISSLRPNPPSREAPELVAARLLPEPNAGEFKAGGSSLKRLLEESALRVKAWR